MNEETTTGFQSNNNKRYFRIVRKKKKPGCLPAELQKTSCSKRKNDFFKKSEHLKILHHVSQKRFCHVHHYM